MNWNFLFEISFNGHTSTVNQTICHFALFAILPYLLFSEIMWDHVNAVCDDKLPMVKTRWSKLSTHFYFTSLYKFLASCGSVNRGHFPPVQPVIYLQFILIYILLHLIICLRFLAFIWSFIRISLLRQCYLINKHLTANSSSCTDVLRGHVSRKQVVRTTRLFTKYLRSLRKHF